MSIEVFTFVMQIINFLVLVALLRRFLYRPIIKAMEAREQRIASRLAEANEKYHEAEDRMQRYEKKALEIDQHRHQTFERAHQEAREHQQEQIQAAKQDIERRRNEWLKEFDREQQEMVGELRRQAGFMAAEAAKRTLSQLADTKLEEQMFSSFDSRLKHIDGQLKEELKSHLSDNGASVFVYSAFAVPDHWQQRFGQTIQQAFGYDGDVSFETNDELICGLELNVGGFRFGWNIHDFLAEMENSFKERLKITRARSA